MGVNIQVKNEVHFRKSFVKFILFVTNVIKLSVYVNVSSKCDLKKM